MPEQLTKHPEVTLQVLRSAGARCGDGLPQEILKQCPVERFCKLPGGEVCIYGLPEAARMTQVTQAEWRALLPPAVPGEAAEGLAFALLAAAGGLVVGAVLAWLVLRWRGRAAAAR
jgi:hypothetical protein